MEITILHRQGYGIRRISRELGVSRNTVRECLRHEGGLPRRYQRSVGREAKLTAYHGYLEDRVKQAQPHRLPATVLLGELRQQGYTGGLTMLRKFLQGLYPTLPVEPVVRFETAAGLQMQVDWTVLQRKPVRLSASGGFLLGKGEARSPSVNNVNYVVLLPAPKAPPNHCSAWIKLSTWFRKRQIWVPKETNLGSERDKQKFRFSGSR